MAWITRDDFNESYSKLRQRGAAFLFSKLNINPKKRTQSSFDDPNLQAANWWIIPKIKERWNYKITGNPKLGYEPYLIQKHLINKQHLKMLSIGSGISNHEISLAKDGPFEEVLCLDLATELLKKAEQKAAQLGLNNIQFKTEDIYKYEIQDQYFDLILFHQSLHHFKGIDKLLAQLSKKLTKDGILVLHEYVGPNRLIWTKAQLKESNKLLMDIPEKWRKRFLTNKIKKGITGPGKLRMIISDPSEAVDSEAILPALRKHFDIVEEKELGGNLLCLVLKDIAHHFVNPDAEKSACLEKLFKAEDQFIANHQSDMIFGIYKVK